MNIILQYGNSNGDIGNILYNGTGLVNRIIFPEDVEVETIGYEIEENEETNQKGIPEIITSIYRKTFSIRYVCDWFLADAISLIKLHDSAYIKLKGEDFEQMKRLDVEIDTAEVPGHAVVVLTFSFEWLYRPVCGETLIEPENKLTSSDDNDGFGIKNLTANAPDNSSVYQTAGSDAADSEIAYIRFEDIQLSQGQSVSNAILELYAHADEDEADLRVYAILDTNPSAPALNSDFVDSGDWTTSYLEITIPAATAGDLVNVYDLASVIEEVVAQTNWKTGNAITLILYTTAASPSRNFKTIESGYPAKITIVGEDGSKTTPVWRSYSDTYNKNYG